MTLKQKLARARARYLKLRSARRLRWYLLLKARTGRWDDRYHRETPWVPIVANKRVRGFITRAFAAGLIPTATTNGVHSPGSYHGKGRAADVGLRGPEVGTAKGRRKMEKFQRAEYLRFLKHQHQGRPRAVELIGPVNNRIVLRGVVTPLPEGLPLENQHDDHCHGAF